MRSVGNTEHCTNVNALALMQLDGFLSFGFSLSLKLDERWAGIPASVLLLLQLFISVNAEDRIFSAVQAGS